MFLGSSLFSLKHSVLHPGCVELDAKDLGVRGEDLVPCDFILYTVFHCAECKSVMAWSLVLIIYRHVCK